MVKASKPGEALPEDKHDDDQPEQLQFPSDDGSDGVENAKRSEPVDAESTSKFVKEFVVLLPEGYDVDHDANKKATLEQAIQQGVHPKGSVSYDGVEDHPDGVSKILTYSVEVIPAHVDELAGATVTPSLDQDDAEAQA